MALLEKGARWKESWGFNIVLGPHSHCWQCHLEEDHLNKAVASIER